MIRVAMLLSTFILSGCAQPEGGFPSLSPRPIETRDEAEPVAPVATATVDATLEAAIATQSGELADAGRVFVAAAARARTALQRGQVVGSEDWLTAQAAINPLSDARNRTVAAQAELEQLAIARAGAGLPAYPALEDALERAGQQADAQTATLDEIRAALPSA